MCKKSWIFTKTYEKDVINIDNALKKNGKNGEKLLKNFQKILQKITHTEKSLLKFMK